MSPPSPSVCYLLRAGFLFGLFFDPEDGGDMSLLNVGRLSKDGTALYPEYRKSNQLMRRFGRKKLMYKEVKAKFSLCLIN
jgi:hypothetical protein